MKPVRALLSLLLLPLLATPAAAQEIDNEAPARHALLGLRLSTGPVYFGQRKHDQDLRPVLAFRWKALRVSNSGGGSLLGERAIGGATTDLLDDDDWRLSLGLRLDRGRQLEGVDRLAELPDVRTTVRGRLALTWHQNPQRDWTLALNPDLLSRGGGLLLQLSYTERMLDWNARSPIGGQWTAYASLMAADRRYQRSYFGVPVGLSSFSPYAPGAGLRNLTGGLAWQRELDKHWMVFGGGSVVLLLGPAARSPIVEQRLGWGLTGGLAYRL